MPSSKQRQRKGHRRHFYLRFFFFFLLPAPLAAAGAAGPCARAAAAVAAILAGRACLQSALRPAVALPVGLPTPRRRRSAGRNGSGTAFPCPLCRHHIKDVTTPVMRAMGNGPELGLSFMRSRLAMC